MKIQDEDKLQIQNSELKNTFPDNNNNNMNKFILNSKSTRIIHINYYIFYLHYLPYELYKKIKN